MHLVLLCVKWKWIAAFHLISTHTHTLLGTRETKTPDKQMKKKKNENFCCSIASHLVFFAVGCCCCCVKAKTIEHKTITRWISITESVEKRRSKQSKWKWKVKKRKRCVYRLPTNTAVYVLIADCIMDAGGCVRAFPQNIFHSIQFNSISIESTLALCVTVPNKHHSRCDLCNTTRFFSVLFLISN